jgi:hypothetical protein
MVMAISPFAGKIIHSHLYSKSHQPLQVIPSPSLSWIIRHSSLLKLSGRQSVKLRMRLRSSRASRLASYHAQRATRKAHAAPQTPRPFGTTRNCRRVCSPRRFHTHAIPSGVACRYVGGVSGAMLAIGSKGWDGSSLIELQCSLPLFVCQDPPIGKLLYPGSFLFV